MSIDALEIKIRNRMAANPANPANNSTNVEPTLAKLAELARGSDEKMKILCECGYRPPFCNCDKSSKDVPASRTNNTRSREKLFNIVTSSIGGLNLSPQKIIEKLLSVEDEADILSGEITSDILHEYLKLWMKQGATRVSGKAKKETR